MGLNKSYLSRNFLIFFSRALLVWLVLFMFVNTGKAAVTLIYFKAVPDNGKVYFEWKTASEENNSGFIIKKKNSSGMYEPLTINNEEVFFDANPNGGVYTAMYAACIYEGSPCEYDDYGEYIKTRFFDENVTNGTTYWYKIVPIDNNDTEEEGLTASAMPWDPSQPTWTPTGQTTHSPEPENNTTTPSPTNDGSTATKTPTGKPTKTKKPGTATPTSTATRYNWTAPTSTPQPPGNNPPPVDAEATVAALTAEAEQSGVTQAVQPTDTLVPLPSVTIVFPTTVVKQPDVADASLVGSVKTNKANSESWLTPQRLIIVAVIAGIWIMLGGWFYLSFKRLEK